MVYETLHKLFRKHFYVVYFEKFKSDTSRNGVERFVAKHPLLKPELIVVNDQIHGFRQAGEQVSSLEKFPIYIELEYYDSEDGVRLVDSVDLYSDAKIKCGDRLSDVIYLSNLYSKSVAIERMKRINDPSQESLLICSRINELFIEEYLEQDLEEGLISESELELMVEVNIVSFVNFLKVLDDLLVKGKKLNKMDQIFNTPDSLPQV